MDKEVARGQVWYVMMSDAVGSEMASGRPGVIISSDKGLETSSVVNVVYITTTPKRAGVCVEINSTKRRSWVLCNQIATIDKSRLTQKMCDLSESELLKVELGLRTALGLPQKTDVDVSGYERDIERLKQNISGLEVELEVHKRLYEKALEKLIDLRFEMDTQEPEPEVAVEEPVVMVEESPVVEEESPLDLTGLAEKFHVSDGRKGAKRLPKKDWVVANINTDSAQEIHDKTGLGLVTAREIVSYRNKNGAFKDVSDLINVPRFGNGCFKRYVDKVCV